MTPSLPLQHPPNFRVLEGGTTTVVHCIIDLRPDLNIKVILIEAGVRRLMLGDQHAQCGLALEAPYGKLNNFDRPPEKQSQQNSRLGCV